MAERVTAPASGGFAAALWRAWPAAARIAAIYVAARIVTTGFLLLASALSRPESRFGADPSLAEYVVGWDATWYWLVAVAGYPSELSYDESGTVEENAWAFMPVYALLARVVGLGTWGAGALIVSLVAGYLACLALHALLRAGSGSTPGLDEGAALWAVAFFASAPLAALFQVGYAEALFLALLLAALLCLVRRRWGWLYVLVPVMGFTRPGVLAFALLLGLVGIARWIHRARDPLPARDVIHIVALGALATAVGFSWQFIAGAVTGQPDAYLQTELAWRRALMPGIDGFIPFEGWIRAAEFWAGIWGIPAWAGYTLLAALVAGAAALLLSPLVRRLGLEVRLWSVSYLVYLLAVFFPQSSTFRLLVPLSPLWGAAAIPRSTRLRLGVLALCLVGQWLWISFMYGSGNVFWQVP